MSRADAKPFLPMLTNYMELFSGLREGHGIQHKCLELKIGKMLQDKIIRPGAMKLHDLICLRQVQSDSPSSASQDSICSIHDLHTYVHCASQRIP